MVFRRGELHWLSQKEETPDSSGWRMQGDPIPVRGSGLEGELQSEFKSPRCPKGESTCSNSNPLSGLVFVGGAVHCARRSSEQPVQRRARGIEIGKVEQVVEANAWLDRKSLLDFMRITEFQIERLKPEITHLACGGQRHRWGNGAKGLQLSGSEESCADQRLT